MKDAVKQILKWLAVSVAVCAAVCWATEQAGNLLGFELRDQTSVDLVRKMAGWNMRFVYFVSYVAVAAPIWEEALFRWFFWKRAGAASPRAAAVASSLAFAGAHYLFAARPDNAFIALFIFGLIQCRLYFNTDRLWCAVVNHSLFNIANMAILFVFDK